VLYVPGDKPRAIEKARTLRPDAIILDLEDAVAPEHKAQAREHVRDALRTPWHVPVLIRVNGAGTPWAQDDHHLAHTTSAAIRCANDPPRGMKNPAMIPAVSSTMPSQSSRSNETSSSLTGGGVRNSPLFKWCSLSWRSSTRNITPATAASASAP
jgi:hypothetical protein